MVQPSACQETFVHGSPLLLWIASPPRVAIAYQLGLHLAPDVGVLMKFVHMAYPPLPITVDHLPRLHTPGDPGALNPDPPTDRLRDPKDRLPRLPPPGDPGVLQLYAHI